MDYKKLNEQLPKASIKWTVNDIEIWLSFIGLNTLYPQFRIFLCNIFRIAKYRWKLLKHPNRRRPKIVTEYKIWHNNKKDHDM